MLVCYICNIVCLVCLVCLLDWITLEYSIIRRYTNIVYCYHYYIIIIDSLDTSETRVFMTIAADLVVVGIQEPVRFLIEIKAKIFPASERFWYFSRKPHHEQFLLILKPVSILCIGGVI